tara:strand:+ start:20694 stop:21413 length:720 start_codon:yes stop_codon:yes gene_type:complete
MKHFCMSLCVLALLTTNLLAQSENIQKVKANKAPAPPFLSGCICPITNFGTFWIGENHPPDSACQSPQPVYLSVGSGGPSYDYGICNPDLGPCGINCFAAAPKIDFPPILEDPVSPYFLPPIRPTYAQFADPRFILLTLDQGTQQQRKLYAKVFTVVVDSRQLVKDYNHQHQNDPDHTDMKTHPIRGDFHVFMLGYEISGLPIGVDPQKLKSLVPSGSNTREAFLDCGLHKGIIFLAKQ